MNKYHPPIILLICLLLLTLACGIINQQYQLNNEVRLAIYEYERKTHGPVNDLIIYANRDEPHIRFEGQNQNDGYTIWLPNLGAEDYFTIRLPERTYLYIRALEYNKDQTTVTVKVYRGDKTGYQGWQLTLAKNKNNNWEVTDEVEIKEK